MTTHAGPAAAADISGGRLPRPYRPDPEDPVNNPPTEPVCKFDEGCHRVVACEPGCAVPPTTTDRPGCTDPIECSHEAALGQARETNRRLNLRAQQLESELAAYRRAVSEWEINELRAYVPLHTVATIAKAAGLTVPERWTLHYERLEQAEAEVRRLGLMVDEYGAGASALTDKLKRVRDLHHPASDWSWKPLGCQHDGEHDAPCRGCRGECWPCPTIRALDAASAGVQAVCKCPAEVCGCGHHADVQTDEETSR